MLRKIKFIFGDYEIEGESTFEYDQLGQLHELPVMLLEQYLQDILLSGVFSVADFQDYVRLNHFVRIANKEECSYGLFSDCCRQIKLLALDEFCNRSKIEGSLTLTIDAQENVFSFKNYTQLIAAIREMDKAMPKVQVISTTAALVFRGLKMLQNPVFYSGLALGVTASAAVLTVKNKLA